MSDLQTSFHHASKFYGDVLGINKVHLTIPPGITGLVGPNGSGKSTMMNQMTGLLQPSRGEVRVLGEPPRHPERLFAKLGYCAQYDSFPKGFNGRQFIYSYLRIHGHAIEVRLYAEDPDKKFFPSPGDLEVYREPRGEGVRVDSGVTEGDTVTVHYDPMLAKLIAWGRDRAEAIARLRGALDGYAVEGIKTTLPFHRKLVRHEQFLAGEYDTHFIDDHMK